MNFKEWLLNEAFDKVSDFLLNPQHRDKTFSELMSQFEASGGKFIGSGSHGQVFEHPSWPYVIKTFSSDDCYLKFARFAYQNPHPSFPKLYGPPQKIVPFYTRYKPFLYVTRMEKLYPNQNRSMAKAFIDSYDGLATCFAHPDYYPENIRKQYEAIATQFPQLKQLVDGLNLISKNKALYDKCPWDMHVNNIMQRADGTPVLLDPVWEGPPNVYAQAREAERIETDYYANMADEPTIRGGKLPKIKRRKPWKPQPRQVSDDIPF